MSKMQKIISSILMSLTMMTMVAGPAMAQVTGTISRDELLKVEGKEIGSYAGLGTKDLRITVAQIIRVAMGLLGIVAVVIVLIGGFTWMTAGGNEEKVAEAKKWIFAGIIGLAIILSAYAIANFVISKLVEATTSGGGL